MGPKLDQMLSKAEIKYWLPLIIMLISAAIVYSATVTSHAERIGRLEVQMVKIQQQTETNTLDRLDIESRLTRIETMLVDIKADLQQHSATDRN